MAGQRKFLIFAALASLAAPLAGCDSVARQQRGPGYAETSTADPKAVAANIDSLNAVVAAHPSDPEAYNTRGVAYAKIGRFNNAISDFSQAIKLDPRHAAAYTNRALAERQVGSNDAAMPDFSHAIEFQPNHAPRLSRPRQCRTRAGPVSTPPSAISTRRSASIRKTPRRSTRAA